MVRVRDKPFKVQGVIQSMGYIA